MTENDVLVGYRLRLFTLAEQLRNVRRACRLMGVHRSTYYSPTDVCQVVWTARTSFVRVVGGAGN